MLLIHRRHVVELIKIRNRLQICLVFDQFLCAAVQETYVRIGPLDDLTVKL